MSHTIEDLIVLMPGALGFKTLGTYPYFGPNVAATLTARLNTAGRRVGLTYVGSRGTGTLLQRQCHFLETFVRSGELSGPRLPRIHLVGHSTGGLDAELLTRSRPLDGTYWPADVRPFRNSIRSVTTFSTPFHGTGLAMCPLATAIGAADAQLLAKLSAALLGDPFGSLSAIAALLSLGRQDREELEAMIPKQRYFFRDIQNTLSFLARCILDRGLIADLRPDKVPLAYVKAGPRDPGLGVIARASFATVAPSPTSTTDAFFRIIHGWTAKYGATVRWPPNVLSALGTRNRIANVQAPPVLPIDGGSNDGVVNTASQCWDAEELRAVIVADHSDIIGHYPQCAGKDRVGFLHSGAHFRDAELVAAYQDAAACIAASSRAPGSLQVAGARRRDKVLSLLLSVVGSARG